MVSIRIDGSYGEGGGQIVRNALALSTVTGKPIEIAHIREKRKNPGLRPQHIAAVIALSKLCHGEVNAIEGGQIRSSCTAFNFFPSTLIPGSYSFDIGTAGSVSLVIQALLPAMLSTKGDVEVCIIGGTDVPMSPPVFYFRDVFLPALTRMGAEIKFNIIRHGFYPKGGGKVTLRTKSCTWMKPLSIREKGSLKLISVYSTASTDLMRAKVAKRQAEGVVKQLSGMPVLVNTTDVETYCPGSTITLTAEYENCILGASALGEKGVPAEDIGHRAAHLLKAEMDSGATVDSHLADQLLVYMAIAASVCTEPSNFIVKDLSEHARTCIWLIEQFFDQRFKLKTINGMTEISIG